MYNYFSRCGAGLLLKSGPGVLSGLFSGECARPDSEASAPASEEDLFPLEMAFPIVHGDMNILCKVQKMICRMIGLLALKVSSKDV